MLNYNFIDPEEQIDSEDFKFVESFLQATGRTQLGWHYITDLTWIYSKVKKWSRDVKVLDAGGGSGPVQFLLAEMGFHVTNIDMVLSDLSITYSNRYHTKLHTLPSFRPTDYTELLQRSSKFNSFKAEITRRIKQTFIYQSWSTSKYSISHDRWRSSVGLSNTSLGQIQWCVGNLCYMPEIPSASFDAVVSLSALEHIPLEHLDPALAEIRRVLKPDALWAVTTSGTEKLSTWLHKPSQGQCFSIYDLENRFGARSVKRQEPEKILAQYCQCSYLKEHLADFYKTSGNFGMPWGIWEPKYIPVGLSQ